MQSNDDADIVRALLHELHIREVHGIEALRLLATSMCIHATAIAGPTQGRLDIAALLSPMLSAMTEQAGQNAGTDAQLISNAGLMAMASAVMNTDHKADAVTALLGGAAQILCEDFEPEKVAGLIVEGMSDALVRLRAAGEAGGTTPPAFGSFRR